MVDPSHLTISQWEGVQDSPRVLNRGAVPYFAFRENMYPLLCHPDYWIEKELYKLLVVVRGNSTLFGARLH